MEWIIRAGRLFTATEADHTAGTAVRHNQGIWLRDERIVAIDDWAVLDPATNSGTAHCEVVDASAYFIMPGLIDAHTHIVHSGAPDEDWRLIPLTEIPAVTALKAAKNAARHTDMGVTTIRDVGAWDWVDMAVRDAIAAGDYPGPRILAAGHGITSPGGHMDARKYARPGIPAEALATLGAVATGPDSARAAAWEQLMRGADLIKINATLSEYVRALGGQCSPEMTLDTMRAICEVAHGTQRKVAAHCHGGPGVTAAIEAGVDTFEHGRFLTEQQLTALVEGGRFLVPTLSPEARRVQHNDAPSDPATAMWYAQATDAMYRTVATAHALGVAVVAGTDAGMPYVYHGGLGFEMQHLAEAGLSHIATLAAATRVAAAALGREGEIGQLHPGYCADLICIDGDPLADITVLQEAQTITLVVQQGRITVDRCTALAASRVSSGEATDPRVVQPG